MQNIKIANVPGKKDDPNYAPVRGHVPIKLYKKFKIFCLDRGVDNSEGLEVLLTEYFESKEEQPQSAKPTKNSSGKGRGRKGDASSR